MKITKQSGFTLPGLVVVVFIMALIFVSAAGKRHTTKTQQDYSTVAGAASVLKASLDLYYIAHCTDSPFQVPTITDLLNQGFLAKMAHVENHMQINLIPGVTNPGSPNAVLSITANMPTAAAAALLASKEAQAQASGNQVVWTFKPSSSRDTTNIRFAQMRETFGQTTC